MLNRAILVFFMVSCLSAEVFAQRPPRQGGGPPLGGPPFGRRGMPEDRGIDHNPRPGNDSQDGRKRGGWLKSLDTAKNGSIDETELQEAIDRSFTEFDRDRSGVIEKREFPGRPDDNDGPKVRGDGEAKRLLPPFFFSRAIDGNGSLTRVEFEKAVRMTFSEMDRNKDGVIDGSEERPPSWFRDGGDAPPHPPMQPNAKFIAAELRFGDRLVKDAPFSADIEIEDTRRLFDGSTVAKKINGAVYRDSAGRTRRDQPIDVGGFNVVGVNGKPQMLVFINDFAARAQYFLDANSASARRSPIMGDPPDFPRKRDDESVEDLGTKVIDGVKVSGTRTTFEIPAAQIGSDRPVKVVTENWFSAELQMIVYSKHTDPLAGEHVFRLLNIRRSEPASTLFEIPSGYKVVGRDKE